IVSELKKILHELQLDVPPVVDYPADPKHGDYSSNVALIGAKKLRKNPVELAEQIAEKLRGLDSNIIEKVDVVRPGFINFWIKDKGLLDVIASDSEASSSYKDKKIMVEFAHPNTHKAFHIGHLRNITTGETVVRLLQAGGAEVVRVNYQGDVGMHIAKALFGLLQISN